MATGQLHVDTKTMKAKANQVSSEIKRIEEQWKKLQEIVKASKGYWQGDASSMHQNYLREMRSDVNSILKRIEKHPDDLLKMAGVYEGTEAKAESMSGKLPKNVIV